MTGRDLDDQGREGAAPTRDPAADLRSGEVLLDVAGLTRSFGGLVAVRNVDLVVTAGEIRGLIGPNGAGKTTFFNCLTGIHPPTEGTITFVGGRVEGLPPSRITRAGIARTFQNLRLFANMTALENVLVGRHCRTREGLVGAVARTARFNREERASRERAHELLAFVGLDRQAGEVARNLPYGDMRRLEIARALATEPRLLLLDEPTAGMNPNETARAAQLVGRIRDQGVTIIVIEHDMRFVMGISHLVTVLDHGEKLAEGPPAQVQRDPAVIEAYLGREAS